MNDQERARFFTSIQRVHDIDGMIRTQVCLTNVNSETTFADLQKLSSHDKIIVGLYSNGLRNYEIAPIYNNENDFKIWKKLFMSNIYLWLGVYIVSKDEFYEYDY